jgi:hypothetical protein
VPVIRLNSLSVDERARIWKNCLSVVDEHAVICDFSELSVRRRACQQRNANIGNIFYGNGMDGNDK